MKKLEAIIRHSQVTAVKNALIQVGVTGMTITEVKGFGRQKGHTEVYRSKEVVVDFLPKIKVEVVVPGTRAAEVMRAIQNAAATGAVGDGKIFVSPVEQVLRIRTGEEGMEAL